LTISCEVEGITVLCSGSVALSGYKSDISSIKGADEEPMKD
ncbi:9153_t:CDS:2, partial [Cetraspora pellucida]